jgi:hypothetical protein
MGGIREVDFGEDNFGDPMVLSQGDSIAQQIINILYMRPGQMPSMPHLGINIRKYMHQFFDEFDKEELKNDIIFQCREIIPYIDFDNINILTTDLEKQPTLLITIPILIDEGDTLVLGFRDYADDLTFNYQFQSALEASEE